MRPIWSGVLAFGLITIPVKLFSATEIKNEVRFHLLDKDTLSPIKEVRVNPETGKEVPWPQIVHGVEYGKNKFIAFTDAELKALPLAAASTIDVSGFVDADQIDPLYFDRAYFLAPDKGGAKAYELLRTVLEDAHKAAIGRVVIRTREYPVAVRPEGRALIMQTLHYPDEVRKVGDVPGLDAKVTIHPNELKMGKQLVASMSDKFDPGQFKSDYKQALQKLVKAKAVGKELAAPKPASAKLIDLQEALKASLKQARGGGRRHHDKRIAS
jgi:DNA end-binding protein Ku